MFHVEDIQIKEQHCCCDGEKLISQHYLESCLLYGFTYLGQPTQRLHVCPVVRIHCEERKSLRVRTNQCVWPT